MRVRLHSTGAEVVEATRRLVEVLDVVWVSAPYPDRGASVLVHAYLEARFDPAAPASRARAARRPRRAPP